MSPDRLALGRPGGRLLASERGDLDVSLFDARRRRHIRNLTARLHSTSTSTWSASS
jgi:hypothetical protein